MKKNHSAVKNLFLIGIVPLLIVALFSSLSSRLITNSLINQKVKTEASNGIQKLCGEIMAVLAPDIANIKTLASLGSRSDDSALIHTVIKSLDHSPYTDSVYYATKKSRFEGGVYADSSDWIPDEDYEPSEEDWFKDISARGSGGNFVYQEPLYDEATGFITLTLAKAVFSAGQLKGVVGADFTIDAFCDLANSMNISKNGIVHIINRQGILLTSTEREEILKRNYFDRNKIAGGSFDRKEYLDGTPKSIIKGDSYYAVAPLGDTPWFAVAQGPMSDFTGKIRLYSLLITVLQIVLCVASAVFISYKINKNQEKERVLGARLFEETQNLVVAAKENSATSQDQSAAVKEIVATMEDSNALSENISSKIKDVSSVASRTSSSVSEGKVFLQSNVEKLLEISDTNRRTIADIQALSAKIDSIWEIVTFITNVADQAKIIAFNADLEASSAGEAGKNFYIVSSEIRRLADGIIEGTREIKEKISEIQQSSDNLILASESGTEKINEGCNTAKDLEKKFEDIRIAAEITADSTKDITTIIRQQTVSSEQILVALKQISAGVESFTSATENISSSSANIKMIAEDLNNEQSGNA